MPRASRLCLRLNRRRFQLLHRRNPQRMASPRRDIAKSRMELHQIPLGSSIYVGAELLYSSQCHRKQRQQSSGDVSWAFHNFWCNSTSVTKRVLILIWIEACMVAVNMPRYLSVKTLVTLYLSMPFRPFAVRPGSQSADARRDIRSPTACFFILFYFMSLDSIYANIDPTCPTNACCS